MGWKVSLGLKIVSSEAKHLDKEIAKIQKDEAICLKHVLYCSLRKESTHALSNSSLAPIIKLCS